MKFKFENGRFSIVIFSGYTEPSNVETTCIKSALVAEGSNTRIFEILENFICDPIVGMTQASDYQETNFETVSNKYYAERRRVR